MNVKLLRKVKRHILEEPRRFAMGSVRVVGLPGELVKNLEPCGFNGRNPFEQLQTYPDCGTVCCIMGWAKKLGTPLASEDANKLCSVSDWPTPFASRYARAKTPATRAKVAAERIEHFIRTKGKE